MASGFEIPGWFGPTDQDWFEFLRTQGTLDEVNFWTPSGTLPFKTAVPVGSPFFFKLKSPINAIGGFGYFSHASILPLQLAWDAFGIKNGAASYDTLYSLIAQYPRNPHPRMDIGCLMISEPVFFEDHEFIAQPADWPRQAVRGKAFSLSEGEGRRVWDECHLRVASHTNRTKSKQVSEQVWQYTGERFGAPATRQPRMGQGTFKVALLDAYERQCAVTTEHSLPVLDAAHIKPYSEGGEHALSNGLVLRADVHRLFDRGYVGVDPKGKFHVSRRLANDWQNGRVYYEFEGKELVVPRSEGARPDPKVLEWHMDTKFLG